MYNHKLKKYKLKYNLSVKKDIYFKKINYYLLKSVKNNYFSMTGGGEMDYFYKMIRKHIELFPQSEEEYDNYFENIVPDERYPDEEKDRYLYSLLEKYEFSIVRHPPLKILEKDTFIYHLSQYPLDYPTKKANFLSDKLEELQQIYIPFKIQQIRGSDFDNIYIYKYRIKNDIKLIHTTLNYTIYNLETYLKTIDHSYEREFNIRGDGDNYKIAHWMYDNEIPEIKQFDGWYEEPDALSVGMMTEIMILGDTSKYLELINIETINISEYEKTNFGFY